MWILKKMLLLIYFLVYKWSVQLVWSKMRSEYSSKFSFRTSLWLLTLRLTLSLDRLIGWFIEKYGRGWYGLAFSGFFLIRKKETCYFMEVVAFENFKVCEFFCSKIFRRENFSMKSLAPFFFFLSKTFRRSLHDWFFPLSFDGLFPFHNLISLISVPAKE